MLDNKNILITGGSGTIGTALAEYILINFNPNVIRILSRDETKQLILRKNIQDPDEKLRLLIGDIREKGRVKRAIKDIDIVFHLAALKHVNACEYNPFEAIKTNILGLQNIIELSIDSNIEMFVFTSTDKAATPCNTMGVTKLLGEKLVTTANYYKGRSTTIFYSVRFGNVLGSTGSLIPLIKDQIENNIPITITDKNMTRYILTIQNAINLILETIKLAQGGEIFVPKMDSVKIMDLIEILINHFAKNYNRIVDDIKIQEIGMFAGEKLYEELFSIEESERTYEMENAYIIFPQITEVSKHLDLTKYPNIKKFDKTKPFNTKEGPFLSKKELKDLLINNTII
ncbi:MAG: polysaccharide biosynthesis protein [Promethearchaeota archaeon]